MIVPLLDIKLGLLLTDALIFLLLIFTVAFAIYVSRTPHLRSQWAHVLHNRAGMISMVVLSFYLVMGLLDSIHFYPKVESGEGKVVYSVQLDSVLDKILAPIRIAVEKTYSAPFATNLYAKETVTVDGVETRIYPRLKHGGSHLDDPENEKSADILSHTLQGAFKGTLVWLLLAVLLVIILAYRNKVSLSQIISSLMRGKSVTPWRSALFTLALVVLLIGVCAELSVYYHVFGTDKVGEDVLYQSLKSIRTGLVIGTLTTLVMLPFAILLGIMAGYFRGWIDDLIQYLYTTLNSIPSVLLIAASILMLQVYMTNNADQFNNLTQRADLRLLFLCLILGVTSWTGLCRLLRGETFKLREADYIQAATAFGVGHFTIILRHILPNVMHIVLITVVLDFSGLVLAEAVLSYIEIGVDPTTNSWGNMINSARLEMAREPIVWWSLAAAFLFMFVLVLFANLFSDAVRDAFDPRLQGSQ